MHDHRSQRVPRGIQRGCAEGDAVAENSLEAFRLASRSVDTGTGQHDVDGVLEGADAIECDCWLTADAVVVVHHDDNLSRMTGGEDSRRIDEVNYNDLPDLRYEVKENGSTITSVRRAKIPTLAEVIESVDDSVLILIELKGQNSELVDGVYDILTKRKRKKNVVWFGLKEGVNTMLRKKDATISIISNANDILRVVVLFNVGLFFLADTSTFDIFGMPVTKLDFHTFKHNFKWMPNFILSCLTYIFGGDPCPLIANKSLIEALESRNIPTFCLTDHDSEQRIDTLMKMKPAAVVTYRPHWVRQYMLNTVASAAVIKQEINDK